MKTLVAFVSFLIIVNHQVPPQITCPNKLCVSFHVIYLERRKLTLIAFVGLETFVCLHMVSHVLCLERCKLTEGAFVSCAVFSWDASKDENSHWLHLFDLDTTSSV